MGLNKLETKIHELEEKIKGDERKLADLYIERKKLREKKEKKAAETKDK